MQWWGTAFGFAYLRFWFWVRTCSTVLRSTLRYPTQPEPHGTRPNQTQPMLWCLAEQMSRQRNLNMAVKTETVDGFFFLLCVVGLSGVQFGSGHVTLPDGALQHAGANGTCSGFFEMHTAHQTVPLRSAPLDPVPHPNANPHRPALYPPHSLQPSR